MFEVFKELVEMSDILNHPESGCSWDLEQTFQSLSSYILEEAHETLEAIDSEDDERIAEELGDLFYTIIFYGKIAERENRFSLKTIIETIKAKLLRRLPHMFGDKKVISAEEVMRNWERIKKEEKKDRKSALDGVPKTLPSLQRAYKIVQRMKESGYRRPEKDDPTDDLAQQIYAIVEKAVEEEIDIESAFRNLLSKEEKNFISWELQATPS